jgi:hypothetical protein
LRFHLGGEEAAGSLPNTSAGESFHHPSTRISVIAAAYSNATAAKTTLSSFIIESSRRAPRHRVLKSVAQEKRCERLEKTVGHRLAIAKSQAAETSPCSTPEKTGAKWESHAGAPQKREADDESKDISKHPLWAESAAVGHCHPRLGLFDPELRDQRRNPQLRRLWIRARQRMPQLASLDRKPEPKTKVGFRCV